MTENDETPQKGEAERPHHPHGRLWFGVVFVVLLIIANIGLGLTGHVIEAPRWIVDRIEARANRSLAGTLSAKVGGAELVVDKSFVPHIRIKAVELFGKSGVRIAVLPDLRTTLDAGALLRGQLKPRLLSIYGAQVAVRRLADGSLDVETGTGGSAEGSAMTPPEVARAIDEAFALPALSGIEKITIEGLALRYQDLRSGQSWAAQGGWLALDQNAKTLEIDLGFSVEEGGQRQARAQLAFSTVKGSPEVQLSAQITDVNSRALAAQSPALAFLAALDAPISGALRTGIAADGSYMPLDGSLEIGTGALKPNADTKPVRFDRVRLDLSYDPATAVLTLPDIAVDGPALRVRAGAKAWLKDISGGLPKSLVGQVAINELKADPEGLFADPVVFSRGQLDFRLGLDPFRVDIGQFVLLDGERRITLKGDASAQPLGWAVALDVDIDRITSKRLLDLWPLGAVPKTREWLVENVATSDLFNVKSAFRLTPGQEPRFLLGWEFRDTEVRFIKTLPPVQDGGGYATIDDYAYTLVLERGQVTPPKGGSIDMAGSVMSIPDLRPKPALAHFTLRTDSSVTAALSLLDEPPFEFLKKSDRKVDIAEGRAKVEAVLDFALAPKIMAADVDYDVTAELSGLTSSKIAPGRELKADRVTLKATREGLSIRGPVTLSGVPMDILWRQGFAPEEKGRSHVEGTMELSSRALATFGAALPDGAVAGKGRAKITLDLRKGAPAQLDLTSDLAGVTLKIPEIGWSKPEGQKGKLRLTGTLGQPAHFDRLELEAAGLSVAGSIMLRPDGALDVLRLTRAKVGNWFDGSLDLQGRGKGQPVGVAVTSGQLDLRSATFGGSQGGSGGGPLTVALDRLQVSSGIALTGFRGTFATRGGLSGDFTGRVGGTAPVRGGVVPDHGRLAIRVQSEDAGAVFLAAGVFSRGVGGALDLTLRPRSEDGQYDGALSIKQIRVTGVPALAELLDAISVVGLLTQLNGPGILFSDVLGDFRLTRDAVEIRNGSAVGPSLGISAAGTYLQAGQQLNLQGTISPVYMLNGIGQIFSKRREGLFGFNYRMTGAASDPHVSVNPLSILTPGMFRDIFRAEPPKLNE